MKITNLSNQSENELSYTIMGAIYNVFNLLGPGLLESVYVVALRHELKKTEFKSLDRGGSSGFL
jgi:hypothetical protein